MAGRIQQAPGEEQSVAGETEVAEAQRKKGIGNIERSGTTRRVNAAGEEFQLMSRARASDNRTGSGLM